MDKAKVSILEVIAEFDDLAAKEVLPRSAAYVLNRSGQLLTKKMLKVEKAKPTIGMAEFSLDILNDNLVVKVGPDVENLWDLDQYQTCINKVRFTPIKKAELHFKIPKPIWWCWNKVPYIVMGTVEKQDNGQKTPLCFGEVDIYDIDIVPCLRRLPNLVVERLRDGIIDILKNPPPLELKEIPLRYYEDDDWCGTGPRPPVPPKDEAILKRLELLPNEWAFSRERFLQLPKARSQMDSMLEKMPLTEKHAFLNREAVEGVKITQILYSNTAQFRDLLADKFQSFRFWLCWYPWIYWLWWPHCYRLNKLGTATINLDGSFNKKVWISICRMDIPDLWFRVRQNTNGVDKTIYARHPVPCNTYWNHPSGKPVNLVTTDPSAIVCDQQIPVPISDVYVMPLGIGTDKWYEITQAHIKPSDTLTPSRGLYNNGTDPYGTSLNIRMQFDDRLRGLPGNGVWYYRWSYRKEGTSGWTQIDIPIVHSYLKQVGSKWYTDTEKLGPNTVGTENNLFWVPDPNKIWLYDRSFAIWQTAIWDAQKGIYVPQVQDGKYELLLEMFDSLGVKVTPTAAGFKYILATGLVGPVDDALNVQPDGSIIFHLHIDNRATVANIQSVALNGVNTGECQFLKYLKEDDEVDVYYVAYHPATNDPSPNEFLDHYDLTIYRGISGTVVDSLSTAIPATVTTKKFSTVKTLLGLVGSKGPYEQCAFAIGLHTWPRTRDGYTRIRAYEAWDNSAFALVK